MSPFFWSCVVAVLGFWQLRAHRREVRIREELARSQKREDELWSALLKLVRSVDKSMDLQQVLATSDADEPRRKLASLLLSLSWGNPNPTPERLIELADGIAPVMEEQTSPIKSEERRATLLAYLENLSGHLRDWSITIDELEKTNPDNFVLESLQGLRMKMLAELVVLAAVGEASTDTFMGTMNVLPSFPQGGNQHLDVADLLPREQREIFNRYVNRSLNPG